MNLDKLFTMQKAFDERVNYNGDDRIKKKTLGLVVELGECANEWRGFKFWSVNQEPRKKELLEEYVDCLHLILSLGIEYQFESTVTPNATKGNEPLKMFFKVLKAIMFFSFPGGVLYKRYYYQELFTRFLCLGESLGFNHYQIEKAYIEKNKVNHQRQSEGY